MMFDELRQGDQIFIDANIFVYHFAKLSQQSKLLLARCFHREIGGYTAMPILAEVLHRLMVIEAIKKGLVNPKNPVQQLKKHPEKIKHLSEYSSDVASIFHMNITILTLNHDMIASSAAIRETEGLLTNDSLAVAVMQAAGIAKLATHDNDFDHVSRLEIYKPADI